MYNSIPFITIYSPSSSVQVELMEPFKIVICYPLRVLRFINDINGSLKHPHFRVMSTPYTGSGDPHSAILTVSAAEKTHGGFYQCRVISGDHIIYSDVAAVTVHCKIYTCIVHKIPWVFTKSTCL